MTIIVLNYILGGLLLAGIFTKQTPVAGVVSRFVLFTVTLSFLIKELYRGLKDGVRSVLMGRVIIQGSDIRLKRLIVYSKEWFWVRPPSRAVRAASNPHAGHRRDQRFDPA